MEILNFRDTHSSTVLTAADIEHVGGGVLPVAVVALYLTAFSMGVTAGWTFGSTLRPINVK